MQIEKLKLKKLNNTRDLGGFLTANGKRVKDGMLIRSGRLYKLPASSISRLKEIGVKTVVDLRTDRERLEYRCDPIDGVKHIHLPLVCTATTGITHSRSMVKVMHDEGRRIKKEFGSADNYMKSMYDIILFDKDSMERIRAFFDTLLCADGCVLWHCNAGKDRTGILAMLILGLLGVDKSDIVNDYIMSDRFQRLKRAPQLFFLHMTPLLPSLRDLLLAMMQAKKEYIENAMDEIEKRFSSFENYFKCGLKFGDEQVQALKDKYLE